MLTKEPNQEQINEWQRIFESHRFSMNPNRKTGSEIDSYFRSKYLYQVYDNPEFKKIIAFNIVQNEHSNSKLPNRAKPIIKGYKIGDVIVGIDLVSGEFYVESADIDKSVPVYDDLFVYRGLDEEDLKNCFLVAEYVRLTQSRICR